MKCNHCGSELTTAVENKKATCPFCGKQLESTNSNHPAARGRFQLSYDKTTLVQFLGDEKNVVIPVGITRIGAGAFHGYGVETVYIPDGVTEIGDNCFNGCKQLREVRIPASVTHISDSAFKDTGKKKIIAEKGSYAWNKYAKPEIEDKPATPNTPAEIKAVNEAIPAPSSNPAEEVKKVIMPAEEKTQPAAQPAVVGWLGKKPVPKGKERQWAQLLGYKIRRKPWRMLFNIFGSKDRLKARIAKITDQELLFYIVNWAILDDVKCVAVKNITDTKVLEQIILNDDFGMTGAEAVKKIHDSALLQKLARGKDVNFLIQRAALARVADTAELKEYLMKELHCQDMMDRITAEADLIDLAITAEGRDVRKAAAEKLPQSKSESKLLDAAATLSFSVHEDNISRFQELCRTVACENPSFFKRIATAYPDPNIRTLTEQFKPSATNLVKSMINSVDNKAYFDDGVVYAITQNGEFKIGYYDYDKAYDQHKKEIASFSQHDDGILIILNHCGTIKEMEATYTENAEKEQEPGMKEAWLRLLQKDRARFQGHDTAWATDTGTIEETDDYNKVAYLHDRTSNMATARILGMAAAFVCLQNFTYDENRYSKFYHNL